jgi:hypothetical protein
MVPSGRTSSEEHHFENYDENEAVHYTSSEGNRFDRGDGMYMFGDVKLLCVGSANLEHSNVKVLLTTRIVVW